MKDLIREVFEAKFDEVRYTKFLSELLIDYDREKYFSRKTVFPEMYKNFVSSYTRLGTFHSPSGEIVDNLIVYLKRAYSVDAARNAQRNFVANHLNTYGNKDAALVAFVSPDSPDWRFSLVRTTIENIPQDSGKFKLTKSFSPAKRWSYLVGENERSHTAQSMFLPLIEKATKPELKEIINAFDIESVTDEFFASYKDLFFKVNEAIEALISNDRLIQEEFNSKDISTADFSKKLLGQIVFLYFLQKKGWLGVDENGKWGTGSKRFLRDLFEMKYTRYRNFFNDVLEHLFYEALASDRSIYDHFSTLFNCRLPFLNGGLFDPIGGYNWSQTHILLPNDLFSNTEKTTNGDNGTGVLDIFDRFNFTVKEDEPLEKEVAVDPEMLGKVFENLLEVNDRKSSGTFYTPRSVVYYMCRESIVRYLEPHIQHVITDEEIRDFIRFAEFLVEREMYVATRGKETETYKYQTPECIRDNAGLIDDLLAKIKVCDPAIGSGAFPVGILSEIVKIRMMLTPFLEEKENRTAYNFKRHCIQQSIYGVDISSGAVEIAKLRLWLSLVVDEDNADDVKPLPNLDYKIVTGNSLLRVQEMLFEEIDTETIENMKLTFFSETNSDRKKVEKANIDKVLAKRAGGVNTFDFQLYFSEVFDKIDFGFDVVIGNPPYIRLKTLKSSPEYILYKEQKFTAYDATGDIYCLFYEKGLKIARSENGFLCFITSNKWLRADYGQKLKDFFSKRDPVLLIDFANVKIFKKATVATNVIIVRNSQNKTQLEGAVFGSDFKEGDDIYDYFEKEKGIFSVSPGSSWSMGSNYAMKLKEKIEQNGELLKDLTASINRGITTGFNPAFIINLDQKNDLISRDTRNAEIIKPLLQGRNIKKWLYNISDDYLLVTGFDLDIKTNFPTIFKHLQNFETNLQSRSDQGKNWWNLRACKYYSEFEKPKLIWGLTADKWAFAYDDKGHYLPSNGYILTSESIPVKYLLAILNSTLMKYYFGFIGIMTAGGAYTLKHSTILDLPIKLSEDKNLIIKLVDSILIAKREGKDTTALEQHLDTVVYRLYDLTCDEIKLIDPGFSLTEEEYQRIVLE